MPARFCPAYPRPVRSRWTALWRLLFGSGSLLDLATATSYRMFMGRFRGLGPVTYVVNDPQVVRRILVDEHADFPKHEVMHELLEPLLGHSIFTTNGQTWARQRKLMEPALDATRIEQAFPRMRDGVDALMERLAAVPVGQPCDIESEMTHFTADVIFRTIFSRPLPADDARRIFLAFSDYQRASARATELRYRPRWWRRGAREVHVREAQRAANEIRSLLRVQVAPRHAAFHAGQVDAATDTDILAALLQAREEGTGRTLDVEELVNEIALLYFAGHETSASALSWALYLLANDAQTQESVHAELDAVLGKRRQPIELEQLRELEVIRRVFRETLRLYPPLSFLVREAAAGACMRSHEVPAGTITVVSPWLIHRHRRFWERPDEFDPDRFLTEPGRASAASAFLPFSIGPRVCVGAGFALQEAALALATVLRHFRVGPVAGRQPMPQVHLTLRSDIGIRLMLQAR